MRLTSFRLNEDLELDEEGNPAPTRFGALVDEGSEICDLTAALPLQWGHVDALCFLANGDDAFRRADEAIKSGKHRISASSAKLLSPVVAPGQVINIANNYHPFEEEEEEEEEEEDDDVGDNETDTSPGSPTSAKSKSPLTSPSHDSARRSPTDAIQRSQDGAVSKKDRRSKRGEHSPRSEAASSSAGSDTSSPLPGETVALQAKAAPSQAHQEEPVPQFFTKYVTATFGNESYAPAKDDSKLTVGGELAVIIGRHCRRLREDEAMDFVGGYCIAHDFAELDWTEDETRWLHGRAYDAPLVLGPVMVSHRSLQEPQNLSVRTLVNGTTVQRGSTKQMRFDVGQLLHHVTRFMPLYPGDILLTGRPPCLPSAPEHLAVGDRVTVEMGEIGTLSCYVAVEHDIDE